MNTSRVILNNKHIVHGDLRVMVREGVELGHLKLRQAYDGNIFVYRRTFIKHPFKSLLMSRFEIRIISTFWKLNAQ